MKIIISADGLTVINFKQVHTISIDISQSYGYSVRVDGKDISYHKKIEKARDQLRDILSAMKDNGSVILKVENSNG